MDNSETICAIQQEFKDLGIETTYDVDYYHGSFSIKKSDSYHELTIKFTCDDETAKFFTETGMAYIVQRSSKVVPPPVEFARAFWEQNTLSSSPPPIQYEYFNECHMKVILTGGDHKPFIENFREKTQKLRYKIESEKFDKEVEEVLSEDEYN